MRRSRASRTAVMTVAAGVAVIGGLGLAWWHGLPPFHRPIPTAAVEGTAMPRVEPRTKSPLEAFQGFELPASAVLQPRKAPRAEAYEALKPVGMQPRSVELSEPSPLAQTPQTPESPSPAHRTHAGEPQSGEGPLPGLVIQLDPDQAERARALASAMPVLRPPRMAGEPGRPGVSKNVPAGSSRPGAPPVEPGSVGIPSPNGNGIGNGDGASAGPRVLPPPTGVGLWSQEPPPAGVARPAPTTSNPSSSPLGSSNATTARGEER